MDLGGDDRSGGGGGYSRFFFLLSAPSSPQSLRLMPSGLFCSCSALVSSLIVISCLATLVPGVQREEALPRASEVEVPALIGFLVLENDPLITYLHLPKVGFNLVLGAC